MSNQKSSGRPKKSDIRLELGSKLDFLTENDGLAIPLGVVAAALDIDSGNLIQYTKDKPASLELLIGLLVLLNEKFSDPLTEWKPPASLTPYVPASGPGNSSDEADADFTTTSDQLQAFTRMVFDYLSKLTGLAPEELQRELENRIRENKDTTKGGS